MKELLALWLPESEFSTIVLAVGAIIAYLLVPERLKMRQTVLDAAAFTWGKFVGLVRCPYGYHTMEVCFFFVYGNGDRSGLSVCRYCGKSREL